MTAGNDTQVSNTALKSIACEAFIAVACDSVCALIPATSCIQMTIMEATFTGICSRESRKINLPALIYALSYLSVSMYIVKYYCIIL